MDAQTINPAMAATQIVATAKFLPIFDLEPPRCLVGIGVVMDGGTSEVRTEVGGAGGTMISPPQAGHFAEIPTSSTSAEIFLLQWGHWNLIMMIVC